MRRPALRLVLLALSLVGVVPSAATAAVAAPRVVGGHPATRAYPFQAHVKARRADNSTWNCGGSLVAARYVVTAAHCLADPVTGAQFDPGAVTVALGKSDLREVVEADIHAVTGVWKHPGWRVNVASSDLGVVRLARPAALAQVRVPRTTEGALWAAGTPATVIGWGQTAGSQPATPVLQEGIATILERRDCEAAYRSTVDHETTLCAGRPPAEAQICHGDSGGPLLVPDPTTGDGALALGGVVSIFGIDRVGNACSPALPSGYARLAAEPLNAWLRALVPSVDIGVSPAPPEENQPFTLDADLQHPSGPGAYTDLRWDLDADGAFDDATGPTVSSTLPAGRRSFALEASNAQGDRESRRLVVDVLPPRSPVAFAGAGTVVREGRAARLTLRKQGASAGTIGLQATTSRGRPASARILSPVPPVAFAAEATTQVVTVIAPQNTTQPGPSTDRTKVFLRLAEVSGSRLFAGAPAQVPVTVIDDDFRLRPRPRSARLRGRGVLVRARFRGRGTWRASLLTRAGPARTLAAGNGRIRRRGTPALGLRLTRAGRRALRRGSKRVVVQVRWRSADGRHLVYGRKTVRLRR